MATETAKAIKKQREQQALMERFAALEAQVSELSDLVRGLVAMLDKAPSRATKGSSK